MNATVIMSENELLIKLMDRAFAPKTFAVRNRPEGHVDTDEADGLPEDQEDDLDAGGGESENDDE